jgi:hypothetical protein
MATIRRNKYGRISWAAKITGTLVVEWVDDEARASQLDEAAATAVVNGYKARDPGVTAKTGQIAAVDAKGKTIALWGEQGEAPAAPKPVASLPGVVEELAELKLRVEMIEEADKAGMAKSIDEALKAAGIPELVAKLVEAAIAAKQPPQAGKSPTASSGGGSGGKPSGAPAASTASAPAA